MTDSSPSPSSRRCGACGKPVPANAETCPACGAFLAAYEVADGAGAVSIPPLAGQASTATSATVVPPAPSPSSSQASPATAPPPASGPR